MPVDAPVAPTQIQNATWNQFLTGLRGLVRQPGREKSMSTVLNNLQLTAADPQIDNETYLRTVGDLVRTHGEELGIRSEDAEQILKGAEDWRKTNYFTTPVQSASEMPQTAEASSQKRGSHEPLLGGGGGMNREPDYRKLANDQLKEKVKGSVQQEFERLLATTPQDKLPDAIEQFYHTHLSAAGVLGSQYNILMQQTEKLYKNKDDFETHQTVLGKQRDEQISRLQEVHSLEIGPLRSEQDYVQRATEAENMRTLQDRIRLARSPQDLQQLTGVIGGMFDQEWARRQADNVLGEFVREFNAYNHSYQTMYEDLFTFTTATTMMQGMPQVEEPAPTPQQPTFTQQQGKQGGGGNLGGQAKKIAQKGARKLAKREAEEKLLEEGAEQLAKQGALTGLRALFAAIGPEGWAIIIGVFLIIVIVFVFIMVIVSVFGGKQQQQQQQNFTPIPGLTLNVSYPQNVQNGQNIPYTIDVQYTGSDAITIADNVPFNANDLPQSITGTARNDNGVVTWNLDNNKTLPDSTSTNKHYQFKITLQPTQKDVQVINVVTATYTNGPPTPGGGGPTAGGYCSPSNLAKYFGSDQNGRIASCICKYESGGDPGAMNKACLRGGTADYSIGLFQVNLIAHCDGALRMHGNYCSVADARTLARCTQSMMDPVNNINEAVAIYHASKDSFAIGWRAEQGKCF